MLVFFITFPMGLWIYWDEVCQSWDNGTFQIVMGIVALLFYLGHLNGRGGRV